MIYTITPNVLYIQTDSILKMTVSGGVYTIVMNDAVVTSIVITKDQFYNLIASLRTGA